MHPKFIAEIEQVHRNRVELALTNKTPHYVEHVQLRLSYYWNGEYVREQIVSFKTKLAQGETIFVNARRDKPARSSKYQVKVEVVEYH